MKKILLFITILFFSIILVGCASSDKSEIDNNYGSIGGEPINPMPDFAPGAPEGGDYYNPSSKDEPIQAGQITSSEWNDNENFDYWLNLISHSPNETEQEKHYLASYYEVFNSKTKALAVKYMHKFHFTNEEKPLANAKVVIRFNNTVLFEGVTNAAGDVYTFFDKELYDEIQIDVFYNNTKLTTLSHKTSGTANESGFEFGKHYNITISEINTLDLALVVDTTGSMSDELKYLQVELQNVLENINSENPNLQIRLALIFYRDEGDQYVTRVYDFDTDLQKQYNFLQSQEAFGGGDTPEAVHSALTELDSLSWSEESTKIAIHVCDAPPHNDTNIFQNIALSTKNLAKKGIRFVPVICSGSDYLTEFIFRQMALYTGGTYTYITDHSGIGGSHTDQATPNDVVVEYLNKMLIRIISEYIKGENIAPVAYNAKDKHTVSFDSQCGSKINVQLVDDNGTVTKVEDPVRPGYIFLGWIVKGAEKFEYFSFDTPITSSITLQAVWANEANLAFIVYIYWNDGREPEILIYKKGETVDLDHLSKFILSENVSSFIGWYTYKDGVLTPFDSTTPITENTEIHAIYVKNQ